MNPRTITHRMIAPALIVAAALLTGCASDGPKPQYGTVTKFGPEFPMAMTNAPETGTYGLFYLGGEDELARNRLYVGEPLGFAKSADDSDGKPVKAAGVAIAGKFVVPIDPAKTYEWRRIRESNGFLYIGRKP